MWSARTARSAVRSRMEYLTLSLIPHLSAGLVSLTGVTRGHQLRLRQGPFHQHGSGRQAGSLAPEASDGRSQIRRRAAQIPVHDRDRGRGTTGLRRRKPSPSSTAPSAPMDLGITGQKGDLRRRQRGHGPGERQGPFARGGRTVSLGRGVKIALPPWLRQSRRRPEERSPRWSPTIPPRRDGRALLAACPQPDIMVITCSPPKTTDDFRDISAEDWQASLGDHHGSRRSN